MDLTSWKMENYALQQIDTILEWNSSKNQLLNVFEQKPHIQNMSFANFFPLSNHILRPET